MYKIKLEDIAGPKKLPGFNGVGEINLEDYVGMEIDIPCLLYTSDAADDP